MLAINSPRYTPSSSSGPSLPPSPAPSAAHSSSYSELSMPSVSVSSANTAAMLANSNMMAQVQNEVQQAQGRKHHDDLILPKASLEGKQEGGHSAEGKLSSLAGGDQSGPIHVSTVWQEAKNGPFKRAFQFIAMVIGSLFGLSKTPQKS